MKKIFSLGLIVILVFSLCACGSSKTEKVDVKENIRIAVQGKATVECMFSYESVKTVLASCSTIDDNGDGTYDVFGKITVIDDFGDKYDAKYEAKVSVDESGSATCKDFKMDTPRKK